MCDPISLAFVAAGTAANMKAQSNARKSQSRTMNANTAASAGQFDKRMGEVASSDVRTMDLVKRQAKDSGELQDSSFAYLMGQDRERADTQDLAARGLITEQGKIQAGRVQDARAESLRQEGYDATLVDLVTNLAGTTGFKGQQEDAATSFASRMGTLGTALGPPSASQATTSADDLVRGAMGARAQAARDGGASQGEALSRVGSVNEAADMADQKLGNAGARADITRDRAKLSAGMANKEASASDLRDALAEDHASFSSQLAAELAAKRSGAMTTYAQNEDGAQRDYFGRSLSSERSFTDGMVGSSQHLEDVNTNLANYKIGSTTADTTFGDLLKMAGSAGVGGGSGGGGFGTALNGIGAKFGTAIQNAKLGVRSI